MLSDRALRWLRDGDVDADADPAAAAVALGLMAHRTPAWRERYIALLDRCAAACDGDAATTLVVRGIRSLIAPETPPVPVDGVLAPHGREGAWAIAADVCPVGEWSRLLAAPLAPCPTVVDIDTAVLALRRAEWVVGSLYLGLAPVHEDRAARTTFRLVGAEPRVWCVAGVDDVMLDVTAREVIVRVPLVAGELVFTPGSY